MLLDTIWSILRRLPPRVSYGIVHSAPYEIVKYIARIEARPKEASVGYDFLDLTLDNPVGLAAGLDKDGNLTWLSYSLGFGFTVVGSVLPYPYRGAERKILKRLPNGELINRLGLPSKGVDYVVSRLKKDTPPIPVAINIAALEPEGYIIVFEKIYDYATWIEVNVSCPNTVEHGTFEKPEWVLQIVSKLKSLKKGRKPILVKLPPLQDEDTLWDYAYAVEKSGADGIVVSNTMKVTVDGVQAGLSGNRLYNIMFKNVMKFREILPEDRVIVAVGGILNVERAIRVLEYADLIEILTVLLYYGPGRVREIIKGVNEWLAKR